MASFAKDLKIGDVFGRNKNGDTVKVQVLNELCISRPTPHVHVVTSEGATCLHFLAPMAR